MDAYTVALFITVALYLWPLVAEVIAGAKKVHANGRARWEGYLNVLVLPFVVFTAALARPTLTWLPPWYVVLVLALVLDGLGLLAWWASCSIASRAATSGSSPN